MPSKTPLKIFFAFRILKILFKHYVLVRLGVLKSDHERVYKEEFITIFVRFF